MVVGPTQSHLIRFILYTHLYVHALQISAYYCQTLYLVIISLKVLGCDRHSNELFKVKLA